MLARFDDVKLHVCSYRGESHISRLHLQYGALAYNVP
jgi:hypothetical protein